MREYFRGNFFFPYDCLTPEPINPGVLSNNRDRTSPDDSASMKMGGFKSGKINVSLGTRESGVFRKNPYKEGTENEICRSGLLFKCRYSNSVRTPAKNARALL
jgi:hypothetical protein